MKKTAIFILLILIYGCGYTAVYKNTKTQDLKINVVSAEGNLEMNNLLKNQIKLFSNDNSENIFNFLPLSPDRNSKKELHQRCDIE